MLSRAHLVAFGLALAGHATLALMLSTVRPTRMPTGATVEVAVWRAGAASSAEKIPEPERPKAVPRKVERRRDQPPPNATPNRAPKPAQPVLGVTATSTVADGAASVPVGNTTLIGPADSAPSTDVAPLASAPTPPAPSVVDIVPVRYQSNEPPEYPASARRLRLQGTTTIRVLVGVDGRPKRVTLQNSSGAQVLDDAALEAVQHWSFQPARRGDKPIETEVDVPVRFRLDEAEGQ